MGARRTDCWKGIGDATPFVPGLPETVPRAATLAGLFREMACCTRCELAAGRTRVVPGIGQAEARVMFVGEAPGREEDLRGEPFVGRAGKLFDRLLQGIGLARPEVFITNVVACRPSGNRAPRRAEVRAHLPWLEQQLRLVGPELVITLGRSALTWFMPGARVTELRGKVQHVAWGGREQQLLPLLHPAAVLRRRTALLPAMEADFREIRRLLGA